MKSKLLSLAICLLASSSVFGQLYTNTPIGITGNNVGIGTAVPTYPLHVTGNSSLQGSVGIRTTPNGTYSLAIRGNGNNALLLGQTTSGANMFSLNTESSIPCFDIYNVAGSTSTIKIKGEGFSYFNGGNVGIATTSPKDRLQVGEGISKVSMGYAYYLTNNNWGTSYIGFNVTKSSTPGKVWLAEGDGGSNGGTMIYGNVGGTISFVNFKNTGGAYQEFSHAEAQSATTMRIEANGKVGIGTPVLSLPTNDLNAQGQEFRLYVKGGIKTQEIKVEMGTGTWADYVFKSDYKLLSLPEVEAHIAEKGHLHKTPSAAELEEKGVELKAATINQQEKIEEIFLHLIEMDKKIKQLEAENAALKAKVEELSK